MKLRVRSADEWRELAPGETTAAPIFVPTTDPVEVGQSVIVEIASQLLPNKVLIRGTVQAWRPALPRMRVRAGATIEIASDEQVKLTFLNDVMSGKRTDVPRRKHHRLPVSLQVRYRVVGDAAFIDSDITEIGVGGALLSTTAPLAIDTELLLEVMPPGAAAPLSITCKVSYHVPNNTQATGLRFVTRDSDGDRRLRELVRRLRAS
ncbi:MAG: PilZ domain-containing protein [Proteobacteria bacterium]|nr:PilZ domain-containing protein [Pseudomonadota bacterium]